MGETFSQVLNVLKASAVTSIARAESGTIAVPEGLDGRLKQIIAHCKGTIETVVNAGGLVEITNDSVNGMICSFVIGGGTAVTEGGGHENDPEVFDVDYPLVGGSTYTIHYTPYDDQSQTLHIELVYEKGASPDPSRPNYMKADIVLKANAITQITVAENHNQISIPKLKGGILQEIGIVVFPTLETVVNAGGKIVLENTVESWKPFEAVVGGFTAVGASGGGLIKIQRRKVSKKLPGNSRVDLDYTPYDDQSQSLGLNLMWRGEDPR